ncbi:ABC transporter ATP-binding protein [Terriglobus sp.]|uniref:ABC transporter ATP-binding protein n=1 Tax=Terriglobus sp. TaxID=1889013 RepID=UPI003B00C3C4
MPEPLVTVRDLTKEYRTPGLQPVTLFRNLNFTVYQGEMLAIVGESGAGKSTLLHLLAGLDTPTSGTVKVGSTVVSSLSPTAQAAFRNQQIGYVWQAHYLLPEFTAAENVAMPLLARGTASSEARQAALRWLREVGLDHRSEHRAGELSGGEQQRVSLARALVGSPRLLLADEPTGNLDVRTGEAIFASLQKMHRDFSMTTILVTHNASFAQRCERAMRLGVGAQEPAVPETLLFPPRRVQ